MSPPSCPVEFTLWWCQRFHRIDACLWTPDLEKLELFSTICQLRAQSWIHRLDETQGGSRKLLRIFSGSEEPKRAVVIRDVLVCEPFVRLLACISKSIRAEQIRREVHPILHDAFVSIRQVRCLALDQLIIDLDRGAVWARTLNRLRITLERWTDMLLGITAAKQQVVVASYYNYGFSSERISEFAYEASDCENRLSVMLEDWLLLQGIRRTMRSFGPHRSLHRDWDSQLRHLAIDFLNASSFRTASVTDSLQLDQRFAAIEHWFSVIQEDATN
ncbi:MAG: hypothetical protein ACOVNQ_20075 [Pirellula sp.]